MSALRSVLAALVTAIQGFLASKETLGPGDASRLPNRRRVRLCRNSFSVLSHLPWKVDHALSALRSVLEALVMVIQGFLASKETLGPGDPPSRLLDRRRARLCRNSFSVPHPSPPLLTPLSTLPLDWILFSAVLPKYIPLDSFYIQYIPGAKAALSTRSLGGRESRCHARVMNMASGTRQRGKIFCSLLLCHEIT
jgi:hypothetical protein